MVLVKSIKNSANYRTKGSISYSLKYQQIIELFTAQIQTSLLIPQCSVYACILFEPYLRGSTSLYLYCLDLTPISKIYTKILFRIVMTKGSMLHNKKPSKLVSVQQLQAYLLLPRLLLIPVFSFYKPLQSESDSFLNNTVSSI